MARTITSWPQADRPPTAWIGVSPEQYEKNDEEARDSGEYLKGTKTSWVIGADEVGLGCLAGPVTVGAVLVQKGAKPVEGVTDSKQLSPKRREALSKALQDSPAVRYALASLPNEIIDLEGLAVAQRRCYQQAIGELLEKLKDTTPLDVTIQIDGLPLDGLSFPHPTDYIIKGDLKEWHIGAASILAKVSRDAYMADMAKTHVGYGWEANAGYGTPKHIEAIKRLGLGPMHRKTFCKGFKEKEEDLISGMFGENLLTGTYIDLRMRR